MYKMYDRHKGRTHNKADCFHCNVCTMCVQHTLVLVLRWSSKPRVCLSTPSLTLAALRKRNKTE